MRPDGHSVTATIPAGFLRIGLRAGDGIPVPVAVHRLRIDRIQPMPGRPQRRDQQTPVGLQRHVHRGELVAGMFGEEPTQPGEPGQVVVGLAELRV